MTLYHICLINQSSAIYLPPYNLAVRQMVMFSATWPLPVHQLAQEYMYPNPVKVWIHNETA